MSRISLLFMTAAAAGTAVIGNAVGLAATAADTPAQTRLGAAIGEDIGQRDKAANRRNRGLDLREQAVRAAEARLRSQAAANPSPPATTPPPGTPPQPDQYDDLARIYQAMKPAAAASVLEQLDVDVQMRVIGKMRERSTAMIMASMTTKAAAKLTMAMAGRKPAPLAKAP